MGTPIRTAVEAKRLILLTACKTDSPENIRLKYSDILDSWTLDNINYYSNHSEFTEKHFLNQLILNSIPNKNRKTSKALMDIAISLHKHTDWYEYSKSWLQESVRQNNFEFTEYIIATLGTSVKTVPSEEYAGKADKDKRFFELLTDPIGYFLKKEGMDVVKPGVLRWPHFMFKNPDNLPKNKKELREELQRKIHVIGNAIKSEEVEVGEKQIFFVGGMELVRTEYAEWKKRPILPLEFYGDSYKTMDSLKKVVCNNQALQLF